MLCDVYKKTTSEDNPKERNQKDNKTTSSTHSLFPKTHHPLSSPVASRKAHKLGIPRPPIRPDAVGLEPPLHVHLARPVKVHPPLLHNLENLRLTRVVQARAAVPGLDVAAQVKRAAREAGLHVAGEARRQPRVQVVGAGEVDVEVRDERQPVGAGEEEGRGGEDEEEGDAKEEIHGGQMAPLLVSTAAGGCVYRASN